MCRKSSLLFVFVSVVFLAGSVSAALPGGAEGAFHFPTSGLSDVSGNGNDAVLNGFSIDGDGLLDMSAGGGNSIQMSGSCEALLLAGGDWTIYFQTLTTSAVDAEWFAFGSGGPSNLWQVVQNGTSVGTPYWTHNFMAGGVIISGGMVTDGQPHDVFWVKSGDTLTLYDGPGNAIASGTCQDYSDVTGTANIGGRASKMPVFWANTSLGGTVEGLAVYGRVLTETEMTDLTETLGRISISFEVDASGEFESGSPGVISVVLSASPTDVITVEYSVTGGTATSGDDYVLADGTVEFQAGETSQDIEIDLIEDGLDEPEETIVVTLSAPTGPNVELGAITEHTFTILDPRPEVGFESAATPGPEDQSPAEIPVILSETTFETVTVDYSVTGGTATMDEDYVLADGTLTFAPDQTEPEYISIALVDDGIVEQPETVEITLSNAFKAKMGAISQHTFTILDISPAVSFSAGASQEREGIAANIVVSMSEASNAVVTVDYAVVSGTATRGADYILDDGTLEFQVGEVVQRIAIGLVDDGVEESPDETVVIVLSNPVNAILGSIGTHTFTITPAISGLCPKGDLNGDCEVNYHDAREFVAQWLAPPGDCSGPGCADLDGVFGVDAIDLSRMLKNWRVKGTPLVINEFMADNGNGLADPIQYRCRTERPDWIELYNGGLEAVDLGGMFLTDDMDDLRKWEIGANTIIEPDGYVVFLADDDAHEGPMHTNFVLNAGGEDIALVDVDGLTVIDHIDFQDVDLAPDVSYGRYPDGSSALGLIEDESPGGENNVPYEGAVADTTFSHDRGFYDSGFDLVIACDTPDATIRYTTDGSRPTESNGTIYSSPIPINSTSYVRAMAYKAGWLSTNVDTQTYMFGGHTNLPILSMVGIGHGGRSGQISLELLYPPEFLQARGKTSEEWPGFQTDCSTEPHSVAGLRLRWRGEDGDSKLNYPFFEAAPRAADITTDTFDRIVLRRGKNSATTYLGDPWVQVSEKVMTGFGCNSMFMYLYQNGQYYDIVNPKERPDAWHWSNYFGGDFEDYMVLNQNYEGDRHNCDYPECCGDKREIQSGNWDRFRQMEGMGAGNWDEFKRYCDVSHFADYTILFWYSGFGDGCDNNYYGGNGNNPPIPYKMIMWDGEFCFIQDGGPEGSRRPFFPDYYDDTGRIIPNIWNKVRGNTEFRMLMADRAYKHLFNHGALTDQNSQARWQALLDAGGTDRGGGDGGPLNFSGFGGEILNILRNHAGYPSPDPPSFRHDTQQGSYVESGFVLEMSGSSPIRYTLDGTDPRAEGGGVSGTALTYSGPIVLDSSVVVKARSGNWSALHEATFVVNSVAENLRITEIMYHPGDPVEGSEYEDDDFEYIEVRNVSDTETINAALVKFTNGVDFTFPSVELGPGENAVVVKNEAAFESRYGDGVNIAGEYTGSLQNGGERIEMEDALGGTILNFRYQDGWYDITDGPGFSLTVKDAAGTDPADWDEKASWRPSAELDGSPGWDDAGEIPELGSVKINEVLAHSPLTDTDWIELYNTTDDLINIGGWFLSDNDSDLMKYEIAAGTTIAGGGYLVFYEDQHFGNPADPGAHSTFALSENGETIYLHSGQGGVVTGYSEEEKFDASESNVAFGRYLKSTGTYNFVAMSENTPGVPNANPKVGPIVINEIMYNPVSGDENEEYIELYNVSGAAVTLYDAVTSEPWQFTDGIDFVFPVSPALTIPAGGYALVAKNPGAYTALHGAPPAGVELLGPFLNDTKLSNGGEKVDLSMPGDVDNIGVRQYIRVDRVVYDDDPPWPTEPDGPDNGTGASLSRIEAAEYGNDVANWEAAAPSPGIANP